MQSHSFVFARTSDVHMYNPRHGLFSHEKFILHSLAKFKESAVFNEHGTRHPNLRINKSGGFLNVCYSEEMVIKDSKITAHQYQYQP